jgi:hypothetical protein
MYVNVFHIHTGDLDVPITAKIDEYGKGAWIALIILGFTLFWPLGLATLGFVVFSGRARCWRNDRRGQWYNMPSGGGMCGAWKAGRGQSGSGNAAFDAYRAETIRRLEDEQKEFVEYLDRLRAAKDKAEFDQFMAERKGRSEAA